MSQENVEIVRAVLEAWNAGDMDGIRDACDPEIIMRGGSPCLNIFCR
jgi:ketosteroid isomerase-like protein